MARKQNEFIFDLWLTIQAIYLDSTFKKIDFAKYLGFENYRTMMTELSQSSNGLWDYILRLAKQKGENGFGTAKIVTLLLNKNFNSASIGRILQELDNSPCPNDTRNDYVLKESTPEHIRIIYEITKDKKLKKYFKLLPSHHDQILKYYWNELSPHELMSLINHACEIHNVNDNKFSALFSLVIKHLKNKKVSLANPKYQDSTKALFIEALDRGDITLSEITELVTRDIYNDHSIKDVTLNALMWLNKSSLNDETMKAGFFIGNIEAVRSYIAPRPGIYIDKEDSGNEYDECDENETSKTDNNSPINPFYYNLHCDSFEEFLKADINNKHDLLYSYILASFYCDVLTLEQLYACLFESNKTKNKSVISLIKKCLIDGASIDIAKENKFFLLYAIEKSHREDTYKTGFYQQLLKEAFDNEYFDILINELSFYETTDLTYVNEDALLSAHMLWTSQISLKQFKKLSKQDKKTILLFIARHDLIINNEIENTEDKNLNNYRTGYDRIKQGNIGSAKISPEFISTGRGYSSRIKAIENVVNPVKIDLDINKIKQINTSECSELRKISEYIHYEILKSNDKVGMFNEYNRTYFNLNEHILSTIKYFQFDFESVKNEMFLNCGGMLIYKDGKLLVCGIMSDKFVVKAIEKYKPKTIIEFPVFNINPKDFRYTYRSIPPSFDGFNITQFTHPEKADINAKIDDYVSQINEHQYNKLDLFKKALIKQMPSIELFDKKYDWEDF